MIDLLKACLEYGAIGVLALGFLALLGLFWRTDKRSQGYASHINGLIDELRRSHVNEGLLIEVVRENTKAATMMAERIGQIVAEQRDATRTLTDVANRVGRCPYAQPPDTESARRCL